MQPSVGVGRQQAIHFAGIAEEEGVRLYSLGTETERLFRTRPGGDYWINHFGTELQSMVDRMRVVYSGLLTYDMQYKAYWRDWFAPGSWRLWQDLDLDVIGVSAWFPLVDEPPTTAMDVDSLRREYERIFSDHLIPMAERNPGRPLVFLEYAGVDTVEAPAGPNIWPDNSSLVFTDTNGNGLDDGQEVQDNMYRALFETMEAYPGLVHGAFFWDTWIAVNGGHWESPSVHRAYSFRGKPSEQTVREWYDRFRTTTWPPWWTVDRWNPGMTPGGVAIANTEGPFSSVSAAFSDSWPPAATTLQPLQHAQRPQRRRPRHKN